MMVTRLKVHIIPFIYINLLFTRLCDFSDVIVVEEASACFHLLAGGRRVDERYVRRYLECDSSRQCEEACLLAADFYCQGFNFRYDAGKQWRSSCELISISPTHLDLTLDFNSDTRYDFFERDHSLRSCLQPWSNTRKWTQYGHDSLHNDETNKKLSISSWGAGGSYGSVSYGGGGGESFNEIYSGGGEGLSLQLPSDECFIRAKTGFRLDRSVVVLSIATPSLYHCEVLCVTENKFVCNTFSYRYSNAPDQPRENCILAENSFHQLNHYNHLVPDRDYDIYIKNPYYGHPVCQPPKTYTSDCFERIRSGLRLDNTMSRLIMHADSLGDCERACINSKLFTCRAFSYRYDSPVITSQTPENCHITDWPLPEINSVKHLIEDDGCELYLRGSYGHGCEFDRFPYGRPFSTPFVPYIPPPTDNVIHPNRPIPPRPPQTLPSYPISKYYPPINTPNYIQPSGYGPSIKPPPSGYGSPIRPPPSGYSPPIRPPPSGYGPPIKPPPGINYYPYDSKGPVFSPGKGPTHFSPSGFGSTGSQGYLPPSSYGGPSHLPPKPIDNNFCYFSYASPARLLPSAIRSSLLLYTEAECKAACTKARETSFFRCASLSYKNGHCELSAIELRDLRPGFDFSHEPHYWLFSWDFMDARCYTPPRGYIPPPSDPHSIPESPSFDWTWERFTVSGRPCKAGTFCSQNLDVGIWSCPVEDGDWDYCCRSGHQCGYSEGYNYPWCYVGSADKDQWRPCSDHYYPYHQTSRPLHWPVAYLHYEGPPNVTIDHQPSLVDNFLDLLRKENARKMNMETVKPTNSSLPEFKVVEVSTETPVPTNTQTEVINGVKKLWTWGQSKYNSTTVVEKVSSNKTSTQSKNVKT